MIWYFVDGIAWSINVNITGDVICEDVACTC